VAHIHHWLICIIIIVQSSVTGHAKRLSKKLVMSNIQLKAKGYLTCGSIVCSNLHPLGDHLVHSRILENVYCPLWPIAKLGSFLLWMVATATKLGRRREKKEKAFQWEDKPVIVILVAWFESTQVRQVFSCISREREDDCLQSQIPALSHLRTTGP